MQADARGSWIGRGRGSAARAAGIAPPPRDGPRSLELLARDPVALERLTYDRVAKVVTYRSDQSEGPTAGTETADPLEFLAWVLTHIPDKGHVTTRYSGWYATRDAAPAEPLAVNAPLPIVAAPWLPATEATRRWAALLRRLFEVDPLTCPSCHGTMRILAFITQAAMID